jgi:hypothetical protein
MAGMVFVELTLAAVLIAASLAKFADIASFESTLAQLGIPRAFQASAAVSFAALEYLAALLIFVPAISWWARLFVLLLLSASSVVVAARLATGRPLQCRCFGQLSSRDISLATLVRNGVLVLAAGWMVLNGGSQGAVASALWANIGLSQTVWVLALGAVFLLAPMCARYWGARRPRKVEPRRIRWLRSFPQLKGLGVGAQLPDLTVHDSGGQPLPLAVALSDKLPAALVILTPGCPDCRELVRDLPALQRISSTHRVVVLEPGRLEEPSAYRLVGPTVLRAEQKAAETAFSPLISPSAVLVNGQGSIASSLAFGAEGVRTLIATSAAGGGSNQDLASLASAP